MPPSRIHRPKVDDLWTFLPVDELLRLFLEKQLLPVETVKAIGDAAWSLAWSVAHVTELAVLETLRGALRDVIAEGGTLRDWLRSLDDILETTGWGTTKAHAQTIFRTTLASSLEAERFEQLTGSEFVDFLMFDAINDDRVRPDHLALDGKTWRKGVIPPEYVPPLGYNCRCSLVPVDESDIAELGGELVQGMVRDPQTGEEIRASEGFRAAPSIKALAADQQRALVARMESVRWPASIPGIPDRPKE